ncbi:DUF1563 domain-containing protein [Arachidicoccus ginsenosidimutans]
MEKLYIGYVQCFRHQIFLS